MHIERNVSLKPYNSFGIDAHAAFFASFETTHQLISLLNHSRNDFRLILGGGSNILFTADVNGYVLKNNIKGIELIDEDEDFVFIKAGAGENWHQFVLHCIEKELSGIENLSLIPGTVGASPMQNIGAYGVEIKDVFDHLEAYHIYDQQLVRFNANDCRFGYRESVFKNKFKNQFVITTVCFRLRKNPVYNISYGGLEKQLASMQIKNISIRAISNAVIAIRSSKLPDPKEIGNAGSFFKNPVIKTESYNHLKNMYPSIPGFTTSDKEKVKVPAAWLIEQCGWKGYRKNDAGCHKNQPLVLVNYGNAKGNEILELANEIVASVEQKFDIKLEKEVNIV